MVVLFAVLLAALPPYLTVPSNLKPQGELDEQEYGEAEFVTVPDQDAVTKQGRRWAQDWALTGVPDDATPQQVWARIAPALKGWTVISVVDGLPLGANLHYTKGGKDTWARFLIGSRDDVRLTMVEVGGQALQLQLPPPAPKPEKVSAESGDFPYLLPIPGSKAGDSELEDKPFLIDVEGQDEPEQVALASIVKSYSKPGLSNVQFLEVYKQALQKAGWTVLREFKGADAALLVHYAKAPRDIWAYLHEAQGDYMLRVADVGRDDLATKLAKECRVELSGVLFDFNKATLKPASDAALARAKDALQANPKLAVEVQGHTDNVGGEAYNQKLSEARAQAVRDWLVKHGIAAAKLTAKGYGLHSPVASNDTPEGRARNRRVELTCRK